MFSIVAYEHVGIRGTDRDRAIAFYEKLGWRVELDLPQFSANEMVNDAGVHINLIYNGVPRDGGRNVLHDEAVKHPGITHPAFVVQDMEALLLMCHRHGIRITEGPHLIGERRRAVFIRDPDGNVLEFDELLIQEGSEAVDAV